MRELPSVGAVGAITELPFDRGHVVVGNDTFPARTRGEVIENEYYVVVVGHADDGLIVAAVDPARARAIRAEQSNRFAGDPASGSGAWAGGGASSQPPSDGAQVLKSVLGVAFSLLVAYGFLAYKLGIFPFASVTGDRAYLKDIITKHLNIPLETVEVTGDTTAVGRLAGGEELAIRWKRTGNEIKCICQKPKAQAEGDVRNLLAQMEYTAKSVDIRPSGTGVGYVGQAVADNDIAFDVTDNTDAANLTTMMYVKVSPRSYPLCAKISLEKELKAKVTAEAAIRDGDLPPLNGIGGPGFGQLKATQSLFRGRFEANGKWYGVELYQQVGFALPRVNFPGAPPAPPPPEQMGIVYQEVREAPVRFPRGRRARSRRHTRSATHGDDHGVS